MLRGVKNETARLDCEVLLSYVLGWSRLKIITEGNTEIGRAQIIRFKDLIRKRAEGMPVAYLTGEKEFMGLSFEVEQGVLIPRADSEIAAQALIDECGGIAPPVRFADVCCGSGAIGISAAKYVPDALAVLTDISAAAVEIARRNSRRIGVADRVKVISGDLLSPVIGERFDLIVSNPPYIKTGEIAALMKDVRDFEPHIALDGGEDGLRFYRSISSQAVCFLKDGGRIIFEIGYDEGEPVVNILRTRGYKRIRVLKDLSGNDRCVIASI